MRIDAIEVFHVSMPLIYPWRTAYGEDAAIESVLVKMQSGEHTAWSEASPLAAPCYSSEWAGGVFAVLQQWLAPMLIGQEIASGEELQQRLGHFKGNHFAKGALDAAWWVLHALERGQPLHRLLGARRDAINVGADFGIMDSIDDLLRGMAEAFQCGFKRVKLKFRPGWDVDMLRAVRQEFPNETIHIDCNSGYTLDDLPLFGRLDDFNLAMIEQPLQHDDLLDHAALQAQIHTPICLDESIVSVHRVQQALDLESCRYVNIKPGRVGGITPSVAIHNACREAGVPCWVGGMLESAVGARLCVALATLDNFTYPADIFPSSRFYRQDLSTPALELATGPDGSPQVVAPDAPGIGAEPDREMLERCCVQQATVARRSMP